MRHCWRCKTMTMTIQHGNFCSICFCSHGTNEREEDKAAKVDNQNKRREEVLMRTRRKKL